MNTLRQLREARNANARAVLDLNNKTPGSQWTPKSQQCHDGYMATIERLDGEITAAERKRDGLADARVQDAIDAAYRERRAPTRDPLLVTFLREGESGFTADQQIAIRNTLSTTTGSQGGFTVPSLVAARFADIMKDYSPVRRSAEVITTDTGNVFGWPISDGSAETAEVLAENVTSTALDPSFATVPMQTWRYSSKFVAVPMELLQDSNLDMEGYIRPVRRAHRAIAKHPLHDGQRNRPANGIQRRSDCRQDRNHWADYYDHLRRHRGSDRLRRLGIPNEARRQLHDE